MSGSRILPRGVGTQITTAPASATREKSVKAMNFLASTISPTADDSMCLM